MLLALFAAGGCAALIYEVVWVQLLSLTIGASALSLGVLLATYLGGMCIGSLALARFVSAQRHPLRVYALLELGIGVLGAAALYAIPALGGAYAAWPGSGAANLAGRVLVAALCVLPPTILMGATLPAVARWRVLAARRGIAGLGFLYAANTGGAVAGSVLAGFYLLRTYDVEVATFVAVALNLCIAAAAAGLAAYARPARSAPAAVSGGRRCACVRGRAGAGAGAVRFDALADLRRNRVVRQPRRCRPRCSGRATCPCYSGARCTPSR